MRIYTYCFYRFVCMWKKTWFRDANLGLGIEAKDNTSSILTSSMALVSLIQISNISTVLIMPVMLLQTQISANILGIIIVAVCVVNFFFVNDFRLYNKAEARWKDEPQQRKTINKWLVIIFFLASIIMMFISMKIVYAPNSLTIPYWGNDWGNSL